MQDYALKTNRPNEISEKQNRNRSTKHITPTGWFQNTNQCFHWKSAWYLPVSLLYSYLLLWYGFLHSASQLVHNRTSTNHSLRQQRAKFSKLVGMNCINNSAVTLLGIYLFSAGLHEHWKNAFRWSINAIWCSHGIRTPIHVRRNWYWNDELAGYVALLGNTLCNSYAATTKFLYLYYHALSKTFVEQHRIRICVCMFMLTLEEACTKQQLYHTTSSDELSWKDNIDFALPILSFSPRVK